MKIYKNKKSTLLDWKWLWFWKFENITILNKVSNFLNSQTQEIWSYYDNAHGGDPLTIYDGSYYHSTQIEKLSGNLGSFGISSTGNSLFVKFESDWFDDGSTGFFATVHYGNSYLNIK